MSVIEQTKLARELVGAESNGTHFVLNGESAEEVLKAQAVNKFNDAVDEYVEELEERNKRLKSYASKFDESSKEMEIMPIDNNILVQPFAENPFQRIKKSESGLIIDLGGAAPKYKSHEDGEIHEEESFIKVAMVMCVGPDCKYIKEGDTVMYTKPSGVPVPFFRQGLEMVNEHRISAVVNIGLTSRFNNIKNN